MNISRILLLTVVALVAAGCAKERQESVSAPTDQVQKSPTASSKTVAVDFQTYSDAFKFSSEIPESWKVEYVSASDSINIYDQGSAGNNPIEQSQIFIRHFQANSFLTLSTVNILSREETSVNGHSAVRYEIEKKSGIADFVGQPLWRNSRHKLIDVRSTEESPSEFYVFAYNPALSAEAFEQFIAKLKF